MTEETRLFSNLELDKDGLKHQPGSILSCSALVAGTTVGAGILALPAVTLPSGVLPSTTLLIAVWFYALVSGLLIAEVNINTMQTLGRTGLGFLAMVECTLGKFEARIAGGAYLFFHYALLVAYIAQGGEILIDAIAQFNLIPKPLPQYVGTILFTTIFGGILYLGRQSFIEKLNNLFVAVVIMSFLGLLILATTAVNTEQFFYQDWTALTPAISVMLVALFFHNIIPVITTQLEGDAKKIRQSILIGSVIPLIMFLAWNAVILGSIPTNIVTENIHKNSVFDPLQILRNGKVGATIAVLLSVFSELAIVTSFIGFVYGLLDLLKDALKVDITDSKQLFSIYSLVLIPSMSLSAFNPSIFFIALDYAGTFSISVLGGILPAMMAWQQRYQQDKNQIKQLIFGGKITLIVMIGVALAVIFQQLLCFRL